MKRTEICVFVTYRQHSWAGLFLGGGCRLCSIGIEGRETGGGSSSLCSFTVQRDLGCLCVV